MHKEFSPILIFAVFVCLMLTGLGYYFYLSINKSPEAPGIQGPSTIQPHGPSIEASIETDGEDKNLVILWKNLPDGTVALKIYRRTSDTSPWELWKTVTVENTPQNKATGQTIIPIDDPNVTYTYYIEAVGGSGSGGGEEVIWTSNPFVPGETPPNPPPENTPPQNQSSSPTSTPASTSTPTSTPLAPTSTPTSTPPTPTSTPTSTPGGFPSGTIVYYFPDSTLSGTSTPNTSAFWARHVNNKIELGWQNLPSSTNALAIFRAQNETGPWGNFLSQKNPMVVGPYTIQIVDDAVNSPHYYQMEVFYNSSSLGIYGPIYLPPLSS